MWQRIVIAGGGTAGWMTAALMSKTLARAGFNICLLESPNIGTVGVGEATIPSFVHFNRLLGIDEKDFLKKTKATFKLGIQFAGWGAPDDNYIHGFSGLGDDSPGFPFYHYWFRWQKRNLDTNIEEHFLAATLARKEKFIHPDEKINPLLRGLGYAYHIDAGLYARYLKGYSTERGVKHIRADIVQVHLNAQNGFIHSLELDDGRTIEADFFIDCTGFRSLLLGQALKVPFISWQHWLQTDRAQVVPTTLTEANFVPYTRATAHKAGWQWRIPLQHRVGNGLVYSSEYLNDDQAQAMLLAQIDSEPMAEPRRLNFTAGMRARFWEKNCLAVGLSSGFLEPLESTSIHIIQSTIMRFSLFYPNVETNAVLAKQFNAQVLPEMERIRDFVILHYHANNRRGESFWDEVRNMALPDSLRQKLDLFRKTAHVHHEQGDVFTEGSWLSVMVGQGVLPENTVYMAHGMPDDKLDAYMQSVKKQIASLANKVPLHRDYLQRLLST